MLNMILSATKGQDFGNRKVYELFIFSYSVNAIATT